MAWSYLVLGVVAPRVNASKLFTGHAAAPPGVCHVVAGGCGPQTLFLEADISEAFYVALVSLGLDRLSGGSLEYRTYQALPCW